MAEIVVALQWDEDWDELRAAIERGDRSFQLLVRGATWRAGAAKWPVIAPGERVWLCFGTIVRGHAELLSAKWSKGGQWSRPVIDLRTFVAETVTTRFRDDFNRGWRYWRVPPGVLVVPFHDWDSAGDDRRARQMTTLRERTLARMAGTGEWDGNAQQGQAEAACDQPPALSGVGGRRDGARARR